MANPGGGAGGEHAAARALEGLRKDEQYASAEAEAKRAADETAGRYKAEADALAGARAGHDGALRPAAPAPTTEAERRRAIGASEAAKKLAEAPPAAAD